MRKKKDTTPVPVSSQRQDQTPSTTAAQPFTEAGPVTPATIEAASDASGDIFAQVDKLEEDLGLGQKRKKAKEVCDIPSERRAPSHFRQVLTLIPYLTVTAQILDGTLQDVSP